MFGSNFLSNSMQDNEAYNKLLDKVMNVDYTAFYRGTVVDNSDPMNMGRVRVRVPQIYGSEEQRDKDIYVPTYAIPWATSAIMAGAGNNTGAYLIPNVGDSVFITYENADPNLPLYFGGILTRNATENFIGTDDANGGKLYKAKGNDFNTDITNRAQRVLYKSLKGATIIIDDHDGDESIKIIDQLGQFISLENVGGGILNRDRSGGTEESPASGRIVIKDAYEDSIDLHNGEIHIKTPKLVIETDDFNRVGYGDSYPDEVDFANTILGTEEDTGKTWVFTNDTTKYVAFGLNFDYEDYYDYNNKGDFDAFALVSPGESWIPDLSVEMLSRVNPDEFIVACINTDYYGKYGTTYSWNGENRKTILASDFLNGGNYYVVTQVDMLCLNNSEMEEVSSSSLLVSSNLHTGEIRYNNWVSGYDGSFDPYTVFGLGFYLGIRGGSPTLEGFYPYTDYNVNNYPYRLPLPVGRYDFNFSSSSGNLNSSLRTYLPGYNAISSGDNSNKYFTFGFEPKNVYYIDIIYNQYPYTTFNYNDLSVYMYDNGDTFTINISNISNSDTVGSFFICAVNANMDGNDLLPTSQVVWGMSENRNTNQGYSGLYPGNVAEYNFNYSDYPSFDINSEYTFIVGYFKE